jgi:hypothetical protein
VIVGLLFILVVGPVDVGVYVTNVPGLDLVELSRVVLGLPFLGGVYGVLLVLLEHELLIVQYLRLQKFCLVLTVFVLSEDQYHTISTIVIKN